MEFPEESEPTDFHNNISTHSCDNQVSPGKNQDICGLCGKRGLSESDEIPVGGNLPDNVCQCFFFSEMNVHEESFAIEQETESSTIQISDSQNSRTMPVIEVSCVEESSNISMKGEMSSSEDLNILELSSSNGLHKLSPERSSAGHRSITSLRSGEYSKTSPNAERGNISSGYALSLREQSSDQINFTSPSSGGDSKISSNKETSPSSGYAMSMGEQSSDRNFTDPRNITSPSSGVDAKNRSYVEKGKNLPLDLSKSNTYSNYKIKMECTNSQKSPNQQSNINIKQVKEGQSSNFTSMAKYTSNTDSKYQNKPECRSSQSSPSEQGHRKIKLQRADEHSKSKFIEKEATNRNEQYDKSSFFQNEFRFENQNIRFTSHRPILPRPFPLPYPQPHLQYMNSAMNMPAPTLHLLPYPQQYPQPFHGNPSMNMPTPSLHLLPYSEQYPQLFYDNPSTSMHIVQTSVPERYSVASPSQANTSYQRPNSEGSGSLSKKSLAEAAKMNLGENTINKTESIDNWINAVKDCIPLDDAPLPPDWDKWSVAENEENEGKSPEGSGFSETTTDERSSTEKSEEENRRQRSLRRPPRNNKKK